MDSAEVAVVRQETNGDCTTTKGRKHAMTFRLIVDEASTCRKM